MNINGNRCRPVFGALVALATVCVGSVAHADAVTDWNVYAIEAVKGFNGTDWTGVSLDSSISTRVEGLQSQAVFDAVNSIKHFSRGSYYYTQHGRGNPDAAVAQASHDVLLAQIPNPATDPTANVSWNITRAWVDSVLATYLASHAISSSDPGLGVGKAAASAANWARRLDHSFPIVEYGTLLTPTSNPGIGLWRQSNGGSDYTNPVSGAPNGFDATGTVILAVPGVDFNWRDVTPLSMTYRQKVAIVAATPLSPAPGSPEYLLELAYIQKKGRDSASTMDRTDDQTAQALFYKQDIDLIVAEATRIASTARGLSLEQNAQLFALVSIAMADAKMTAYDSKYEQKFWRPITALNADADGQVRNNYTAWRPLGTTPSHPSNTSGHSAASSAGFEMLRAYFGDKILPSGVPVTLGSLPWLLGKGPGTGKTTSRVVASFTQAQLETGASRLYLGVHYGFDNLQGQLVGLRVADTILRSSDPAAQGLSPDRGSAASLANIRATLLSRSDLYGLFGRRTDSGPEACAD